MSLGVNGKFQLGQLLGSGSIRIGVDYLLGGELG